MTEDLTSPHDNLLDELEALLIERSVSLGDFTLASGARSDYYIDARCTTMSAHGQRLIGAVALAAIRNADLDATHVGGLTLGADPVAYAIAHRSALGDGPILDAFTVRKEPKAHGTGQQVEGGLPAGARCVLVEDTMTTGKSSLKALEAIRAVGAEVIAVLTIVDRSEGAERLWGDLGIPLYALYRGEDLVAAARRKVSA